MAWDLWYGAQKYMLPHLVDECRMYISSVLDPKNACKAYEFAHLFDEKPLMDNCLKIICTNTKTVLNDISFDDVDLNTVITVFSLEHLNIDSELDLFNALARYAKAELKTHVQMSSLDDSGAPSKNLEESKLNDKGLLSGESSVPTSPPAELDSNPEVATSEPTLPTADKDKIKKEKPSIHTALQKIRFLSLNAQEFGEGPACSCLLTKAESFAIFMNIVSKASAEPMPSGFSECREQRKPPRNLVGALCSYTAQEADEISFDKDDIIELDGTCYGTWWKGQHRGQIGFIPSRCVTKLC